MSHPLFPIIAIIIFAVVYGAATLLVKLRPNETENWKVLTVSLAIFLIIMFSWRHSGTAPQRWAVEQCKNSKLIVYETVFAQGFYEYSFNISTDLLRAIMDGSFRYVEAKAKREYSDKTFAKYYISDVADKNCQSTLSIKITEGATRKRQYARRNLPSLEKGQCIAVEFSDELESKYEYYSNTKNAFGRPDRRVSTKLVKEIESRKVLAEWKGYSGSSMWGASKSCGYMEEDLPFKKVLLIESAAYNKANQQGPAAGTR
ncbi:hypothetical protein NO559_16290 [Dasania sp. GY-MA-18]|uniref:Uncharacterized protein n=1 Tax=Dasania phycosphaerae TaxID=2950436 RepID=A0A9J6RR94_9GAMM|nr:MULTISPECIES: hypothetical protein [Dasania]MCR8924335.1 hypothetical protein [Dasania sp. GY-MA-18]MCZ0866988.1 hypothetical protein [Dasania phycosphaerae]MCZ0870492.1 hypothetical protein [Dasania phycosphaerae]